MERAEQTMMTAAQVYAARVRGVVLARLQGPKARKHTRYWQGDSKALVPDGLQVKAMDPDYIVPDSLIGEAVESMREAAAEVAAESARDAGARIVGAHTGDGGAFEVDEDLLAELIDEALEDMLGAAGRYAQNLREVILDNDVDDVTLDDLVETVESAAERGGNWLRLSARTVGTALAGKAVLEQARALGVTHTQWISRRDERVRAAHVAADGQVRALGDAFDVGGFALEYPGDPSGLPATGQQVHGCRCGLLLSDVDDAFFSAITEIADVLAADAAGEDLPGVDPLFDAARGSRIFRSAPDDIPGMPDRVNVVPTPEPVVGWRVLDAAVEATPGQVVSLPPGTTLGLAPPSAVDPQTFAVRVPAGTSVGVSGGVLTLPEGAEVTVLASGPDGLATGM